MAMKIDKLDVAIIGGLAVTLVWVACKLAGLI